MEHLEEYKRLSQPVEEYPAEHFSILKQVNGDIGAIREMEHLTGIIEMADKVGLQGCRPNNERFIFVTSRPELAKQAILSYEVLTGGISRRRKPVMSAKDAKEEKETNMFRQLFMESFEQADEEDESERYMDEEEEDIPGEVIADWKKDYLMLTADQFCPEKTKTEQYLKLMMEDDKTAKILLQNTEKLFLNGFEGTLSDKLVDSLARCSQQTIVLAIPENMGTEYYVNRLVFEQGFEILPVPEPKEDHYTKLLAGYLSLRRLKLKDITEQEILHRLVRYRKALFEEKDLIRYVDRAEKEAMEGQEAVKDGTLSEQHFVLRGESPESESIRLLEGLIGLEEMKHSILALRAIRQQEVRSGKNSQMHNNLVFSGNPGTGKSVVARIYSQILSDIGASNGRFISAGRSDLIGQYVGHTAPMIKALFQKARGGVLFIDEAGCLLQDDVYTKEAITELVRHMEEEPQTTVIFATYPKESRKLLQTDPGFHSRIRKVLTFDDYDNEELLQILSYMAKEKELTMSKGCREAAGAYFRKLRAKSGHTFGNAREARKLLEQAYEQYCLRISSKPQDDSRTESINRKDLELASKVLLPEEAPVRQRIGFIYPVITVDE